MAVLITGATGFIGKKIIEKLVLRGEKDIRILTRHPKENFPFPVTQFKWDIKNNELPAQALEGLDCVINLAGENIADSRWSEEKKAKILNSRVNSTRLLVSRIKNCSTPPKKFINASAIGYYGDCSDRIISESSQKGEGFLSDVCQAWENEAKKLSDTDVQYHILRIGLVLDEKEGALPKMLTPFKLGVGGKLSSGNQYMSWIHIEDLIRQILFVMDKDCQHEIFNCVSPTPITNKEFTKILAKVLRRPSILPVPKLALKLVLGDLSSSVTSSLRVIPKSFLQEGFNYKYNNLKATLETLLSNFAKGEEILERYQFIPRKVEEVFPFFTKVENLERITPKSLHFNVLNKTSDTINKGTIINYKLKLHGIPLKWKTRINTYVKGKKFIDEQVKGPYKKWIHTHKFYAVEGGTLMKDRVIYKFPMGPFGAMLAGPMARKDLKKIFSFRFNTISEKFGKS